MRNPSAGAMLMIVECMARKLRCLCSPITAGLHAVAHWIVWAVIASMAGLVPVAHAAQHSPAPIVIGFLTLNSQSGTERALQQFKDAMASLGWKEGVQYVFEPRWANGSYERLEPLARELASRKPGVVVGVATRPVAVMTKAAPNTPIVHVSGSDPVGAGFAKSLARPGGMVTGITNINADIQIKFVELLLEAAPKSRRIGFLVDSGVPRDRLMEGVRQAISRYAVDAHFAQTAKPEDIESALSGLAKSQVQGLVVLSSPLLYFERQRIVKFALSQRWPMIAAGFAEEGALMSYSEDEQRRWQRAAFYVDRILKGVKPGDLPIEQPMHFELVLNMKTAKTLGITFPQTILVRANRVIE